MRRRGFTLIEMAIVTVIIGILAAALLPKLSTAKEKANNARVTKQTNDIVVALESYYLFNNTYPVSPTCNGVVKSDCTLSGVKSEILSYLGSIPEGNNGTTGWTIGNGNIIPRGESYGYVGSGKYYILSYIFIDSRDGQRYKAVRMPDGKWWMAENLNYKTPNSACYTDLDTNCENGYGRLYTWNDATLACPPGFHPASDAEWTVMLNKIESLYGGPQTHDQMITAGLYAARHLMSVQAGSPGLDTFGFSAKTAGGYIWGGVFHGRDWYGMYWTNNESAGNGILRFFSIWNNGIGHSTDGKHTKRAIRCVRD